MEVRGYCEMLSTTNMTARYHEIEDGWSFTCHSNYLKLQVFQNKSLRLTGNYPTQLHDTLNVESIQEFIHRFTPKLFAS